MAEQAPRLRDYALLSDCHSAALVSTDCAIDWACISRFDQGAMFARLLDWKRGGTFALAFRDREETTRRYLGRSLVLETTVKTGSGVARLVEGFSMRRGGAEDPHHQLLRVVDCLEGSVSFEAVFEPRFDYGQLHPWMRNHHPGVWSAVGGPYALVLSTDMTIELEDGPRLVGEATMRAGDRLRFSLVSQPPHRLEAEPLERGEIDRRLEASEQWWEDWARRLRVEGPHKEMVERSAAVLKGLTCAPTGAIVAAPTTSLPEWIGGPRNWDYRYTWIRDSALVIAALDLAGDGSAARRFRDFVLRTTAGSPHELQIMYGVDGTRFLPERELDLGGYHGSTPVRVGNAAYDQVQHDSYGQLLDAAFMWEERHEDLAVQEWSFLRSLANRAAEVWTEPDNGIWEFRSEPRHFVHSKVWLWVALDRAVRFVDDRGMEADEVDEWRAVRAKLEDAIAERGVDDSGSFVQEFDGEEVDAALLELPFVGFVDATDERMVRTVDRIRDELSVPPQGFVHRYRTDRVDDGVEGEEGVFLMCSFWLVDVLAMQGRLDEAEKLFDDLCALKNDVGLFSEQYDPATDTFLGNFPQAFTHMALINSAHQLASARRHPEGHAEKWSTIDRLRDPDWE